jgi:hypothetical protein
MGEKEKHIKFESENLKGSDRLGDLGVDIKIILKLALKK